MESEPRPTDDGFEEFILEALEKTLEAQVIEIRRAPEPIWEGDPETTDQGW